MMKTCCGNWLPWEQHGIELCNLSICDLHITDFAFIKENRSPLLFCPENPHATEMHVCVSGVITEVYILFRYGLEMNRNK